MMLLFSHFAQATSLVPTVLGSSTVGTQVVFIPTAALAEAVDMSEYTAGNRQALEGLGFAVVELELSTATPSEIEQTITQADALFIDGGNTFYLLQELKRTGAYELVKNHIHAGKLYMGNSAGSIITAPDIGYCTAMEHMDSNKLNGSVDTRGLGAVDFYPVPHVGNPMFDKAVHTIIADYTDRLSLLPLTDQQAVHIHDGIATTLTAQ